MKALLSAEVDIQVPFHDADPMGVTWHGNYLRYFEQARCALLDEFNYNYRQMAESGYMWPIVDTRLKYVKTSSFDQWLVVKASLLEFENRLKIEYQIRDKISGDILTKGYSIQVAVNQATGEMCFVSPDILLQRLAELGICIQE